MRIVLLLLSLLICASCAKRAYLRVSAYSEQGGYDSKRLLESRGCEILRVKNAQLDAVCDDGLESFEGGDVQVLLEDVDTWIREERQHIRSRMKRSTNSQLDFSSFPSFEEIETYLHHIAKTYPGFVRLETLGYTHENRSLYLLHIGQTMDRIEKKAMFIDGGIHAREWASVSSVAYIITRLVSLFDSSEGSHSDVRSQVNWYIMPIVNPDGYEYTRNHQRLWRKNRSPPPEGSNCFGVDLNRNWNVSGYGVGASEDPCSDIYKGRLPDSEPEVIAAKKALSSLPDVRQYLGFHSFGSYILTPFGYTMELPSDNERIMKVGHAMQEAVFKVNGRNYTVGSPAHIFYAAGGASDDYSKLYGIPTSMTIELPEVGGAGFLLPKENILEIAKEAWASLGPAAAHILEYEDYDVTDSVYVVKKQEKEKDSPLT